MKHEAIKAGIEAIAAGLELVAVLLIALAFAHALLRAVRHFGQKRADAYEQLRRYLGRALLLGLEFLVAADIIRTVLLDPNMSTILSLGLLVVVRIVLGWSIAVEIEGCWPWQVARRVPPEGPARSGSEGASV